MGRPDPLIFQTPVAEVVGVRPAQAVQVVGIRCRPSPKLTAEPYRSRWSCRCRGFQGILLVDCEPVCGAVVVLAQIGVTPIRSGAAGEGDVIAGAVDGWRRTGRRWGRRLDAAKGCSWAGTSAAWSTGRRKSRATCRSVELGSMPPPHTEGEGDQA